MSGEPGTTRNQMVSTPGAAADASRAPIRNRQLGSPDAPEKSIHSVTGTVCGRRRAHGAGLITMADPRARDTWNELEEARRVESDPGRLDEFISVQLSQDAHDRIARALHWKRSPPSACEEPPYA